MHPECEYDEFGFKVDRSKFLFITSTEEIIFRRCTPPPMLNSTISRPELFVNI